MKRIVLHFLFGAALFSAQAQVVSTFAGNGIAQYLDGTALNSSFEHPHSLVMDKKQNIYVGDNKKIRKITPVGDVSTLVGDFFAINGLAIDKFDNLFIADGQAIFKITSDGVLTGLRGSNGGISGFYPIYRCITVDELGNLYAVQGPAAWDPGEKLLKIATDGTSTITALPAAYVSDLATDKKGNVYATATFSILKIKNGVISTIAGSTSSGFKDGLGTDSKFSEPQGLCVDANGNIFIADTQNQRIRKINTLGQVTTVAGIGTRGDVDGPAFECNFDLPHDVVSDSTGNLYVGDVYNAKIRKITMPKIITGIEKRENLQLDLFPNPASRNLTIKSAMLYNQYSISNQTGHEIQSGKIESNTINVESLNAGVYFLKLQSESGESVVRKFVKQ